MENIVRFGFAYLSLFESFQALPAPTCTGTNGTSCCLGFKWDLTQTKCLPCDNGYIGQSCEIKCLFPSYGVHCQMKCNCIEKDCDHVNGCKRSATGWDSKIITTELLESEDSTSKICEKGFKGTNCETRCPYPSYGLGCQKECNCIDNDCDHINGCMRSAKVCEKGFYGANCETRCPYPSYGFGCQKQCYCVDKDCDHVNGCMRSAKGFGRTWSNQSDQTVFRCQHMRNRCCITIGLVRFTRHETPPE